jgi:hypothetical protein
VSTGCTTRECRIRSLKVHPDRPRAYSPTTHINSTFHTNHKWPTVDAVPMYRCVDKEVPITSGPLSMLCQMHRCVDKEVPAILLEVCHIRQQSHKEIGLHRMWYMSWLKFDHKVFFRCRSLDHSLLPTCEDKTGGDHIIFLYHLPDVRFEDFTAVTMENGVFLDATRCGSCNNRRFRGT